MFFRSPLSPVWVLAAMLAAMGAVGALSAWDEERDSEAGLEDFAQHQAVLARGAASALWAHLQAVQRDAQVLAEARREGRPPSAHLVARYAGPGFEVKLPDGQGGAMTLQVSRAEVLDGLSRFEVPSSSMVVVQAPGDVARTLDGRALDREPLAAALGDGRSTLRLSRPEAARLGLPERTAVAGIAHLDAAALGQWSVAAVASASRERDRERRDLWRLLIAVLLAGGAVLGFGSVLLRQQRRQLELGHALEVSQMSRERDERLERLGKMATLVTLASGVAHEVSTPLGVIVGRAEQLLPRVRDDERATRAVQAVLEQAERISQIVRGFLTLARDGTPTLERVSPASVVSGALGLVEHRFEKAGVQLSNAVQDDLPLIGGDRRLLEHALVNLLLNACDASPRAGRVSVSAAADREGVEIQVRDEGSGIDAEDAARVTEPFFTTKPHGQGTGLGLAIANEIAKSHRGSLAICAGVPRGTRASLRIPLADGGERAAT
ncbi:MAG: HAMP domain-containing histidine kinase [Archangiaceae bacterium]|nr:HAMP domain-containing histidine kinase [Archangiaceae bacterium]